MEAPPKYFWSLLLSTVLMFNMWFHGSVLPKQTCWRAKSFETERNLGRTIAQSGAFPASRNKPLECITWADMSEFLTKWLPACIALAHTDHLNVIYSFVLVVLHCNYYPYLTYLWPEIRKMISDNSSLHASSNTGYHSHSSGSLRNAPEVFLCTERPEETDCLAEVTFPSHNAAKYIEHAQLLTMDYPNMLTAVSVRNQ